MQATRTNVAQLKRISLEVARETLRTGFCMAPQVHLFFEPDDEYIGYVSCREYYRGQDAVAAIGHLGVIAAAMCATRLLVVWEESDLRTSIFGPSATVYANGLALLETSLTDHEITRHPFRYTNGHAQPPSLTAYLDIQWGQPSTQAKVDLLPGTRDLIDSWRAEMVSSHGPQWVQAITDDAVAAGYSIRPARSQLQWRLS